MAVQPSPLPRMPQQPGLWAPIVHGGLFAICHLVNAFEILGRARG